MLVGTLHLVGLLLVALHFFILHLIGQQDYDNHYDSTYNPGDTLQVTTVPEVVGYIVHITQVSWCFVVLIIVAKSITRWNITQMWSFYLLTCVSFGCVYRFYFSVDADGISLPKGWDINQDQQLTYSQDRQQLTYINATQAAATKAEAGAMSNSTYAPVASEIRVSVMCLYFSITTQTSVGYGDIVPIAVTMRGLSALHMFIGMVYGSMLVGLTIESDMSILLTSRHQQLTKQLKRLIRWRALEEEKQHYRMGINSDIDGVYTPSIYHMEGFSICQKGWTRLKYASAGCCCDYKGNCTCAFIKQCIRNSIVKRTRQFLRAHLLSFNITVVVGMNIVLTLIAQSSRSECSKSRVTNDNCNSGRQETSLDVITLVVATTVHVLLLMVLLSVSMKYVKRTEKVTVLFLCCSFLATCIIFGSMYTLLSLRDHDAFSHTSRYAEALEIRSTKHGSKKSEGKTLEELLAFLGQGFFTFQYYSMTTMTTTGYGYVYPNSIFAMIMVMCQELLSFLFATYVLGVGIQSVATAIEMKKNPEKYGLVNEDVGLNANLERLLGSGGRSGEGDSAVLAEGVLDNLIVGISNSSGDGSGGGDGNAENSNGNTNGTDHTNEENAPIESCPTQRTGSRLATRRHGRQGRQGSDTVNILQERLSKLESAMKDSTER